MKSPTSLISSPTPEIAPPIVPQLDKCNNKKNEKNNFIMKKVYSKKHTRQQRLEIILHLSQFQ